MKLIFTGPIRLLDHVIFRDCFSLWPNRQIPMAGWLMEPAVDPPGQTTMTTVIRKRFQASETDPFLAHHSARKKGTDAVFKPTVTKLKSSWEKHVRTGN